MARCAFRQLQGTAGSRKPDVHSSQLEAFVRPRTEYCGQTWRWYLINNRKMLEHVQRVYPLVYTFETQICTEAEGAWLLLHREK